MSGRAAQLSKNTETQEGIEKASTGNRDHILLHPHEVPTYRSLPFTGKEETAL